MTFQASAGAVAAVLALTVAAFIALTWAEWRRPNRRRLARRIAAAGVTVLGLALLGLRPVVPARVQPRGRAEAAFYLPGFVATVAKENSVDAPLRFALPGTTDAPAAATVLPDVAALHRHYPEVGTVHLYGDGLEPFDLDGLRGLRVTFHPPDRPLLAVPAITFLRCPRELPLGTPLEIQGRVKGLPPGASASLTLIAPDDTVTTAATSPAGDDGTAPFALRGPAPPAAGRFDWRLRLARGADRISEETLGVTTVRPSLPRVLVLESAPRFDTADLRRWFEQAGGTLLARTQIGREIYRFAGSDEGRNVSIEFGALDTALLAGYDLLLTDGRSLQALKDSERTTLRAAVADTGLGILTLADDAVLTATPRDAARDPAAFLLPWTLRPILASEPAAENADRSLRPRWPGMTGPVETPIIAPPWEIIAGTGQSPLARDEQGRVVAATSPVGRGLLGLTVVRETGRWPRANDLAAFAAYWSHLFSHLARPDPAAGHWSLPSREVRPIRVDEPLEIIWQSAGTQTPEPARATDESGEEARLPFIGDPVEPGRWRTTYWPRRPGWQRVTLPDVAPCDFRVDPPGTWPTLTASYRQLATARYSADSVDAPHKPVAVSGPTRNEPIAPTWWWAAFLLGAGTLWIERRLAAGGYSAQAAARPPVVTR